MDRWTRGWMDAIICQIGEMGIWVELINRLDGWIAKRMGGLLEFINRMGG